MYSVSGGVIMTDLRRIRMSGAQVEDILDNGDGSYMMPNELQGHGPIKIAKIHFH
jgi:hypothetical protein